MISQSSYSPMILCFKGCDLHLKDTTAVLFAPVILANMYIFNWVEITHIFSNTLSPISFFVITNQFKVCKHIMNKLFIKHSHLLSHNFCLIFLRNIRI